VGEHPRHGRRLEEIGPIEGHEAQPVAVLPNVNLQIEPGGGALELDRGHRQSGHRGRRHRGVVNGEGDLYERVSAHVARGREIGDEPLEGQVLVRVRAKRRLAHPAEELAERQVLTDLRPENERIHEKADEPLRLLPRPIRDGRCDGNVRLPRVAREQHLERGEHRHEQRAPLRPRELLERPGERGGKDDLFGRAPVRGPRGTRVVERELQGLHAGELRPPIGEERFELPRQMGALPYREIGILNGKRWEHGRFAPGERVVERRELADDDPHRPSVAGDMMHREDEGVLVGPKAQKRGAQHRATQEIERFVGLAPSESLDLAPSHALRETRQIERLECGRHVPRNPLEDDAPRVLERGPENLVTLDERIERAP